MSTEMDRKLAEMSYEYNRRITALSAEYDKLASLVTQILARGQTADAFHLAESASTRVPDLMHSLSQVAALSLQNQLRPSLAAAAAAAAPSSLGSGVSQRMGTLGAMAAAAMGGTGKKRPAPEEEEPSSSRQRTS